MCKISQKQILSFISNKNLYANINAVLKIIEKAAEESERELYNNAIDPFSALFDVMSMNIKLSDWLEKEKTRQLQKTKQNAIGLFHQRILGNFSGWKSLDTGEIVDLVNNKLKIIAEVKNKYNTTKGNHKVAVYDDLRSLIKTGGKYEGYTGYYVEIIPKNKKIYNKEYTPPDNKTKRRRKKNKQIRVIDGKSFYDLASGNSNTLKKIYNILPEVIGEILHKSPNRLLRDKMFQELFDKTY